MRVREAVSALLLITATTVACTPATPTPGPVPPTIGDTRPSSETFWIGEVTVSYNNVSSSGRVTSNKTTYRLGPDATAKDQASWTSRYEHLEEHSGDCSGLDSYYSYDQRIGEGNGGPGVVSGTSYSGPQGINVSWYPGSASVQPGYTVQAYALSQDRMGMIPTVWNTTTKNCFQPSSSGTSYPEMRVEFGGTYLSGGISPEYEISPLDDKFVLVGRDMATAGSSGLEGMSTSYRLRRKDCTGVPDSDSDGYDDCAEFDAGTDWNNAGSHPVNVDTDSDGVADPQDWCPHEGEFVLGGLTAGCPIGRGPRIADITPLDWKGATVGYTLGFDANRWQNLANNTRVSGFAYARSSTFSWDFGDGHNVTVDADHADQVTHTYSDAGKYTVRLRVTDPTGRVYTQTTSLEFTGNPLVDFAPEVRLHPDEQHFPMNPKDYLQHSTLKWRAYRSSLGTCLWFDEPVADPPAPGRLGTGDPSTRYAGQWQQNCPASPILNTPSDRFTRPNDPNPERGLLPTPQGFFLDFDTAFDPNTFTPAPALTEQTDRPYPEYINDDTVNTYWFFYGYNKAPGPGISAPFFDHQADWEHLNVHLDRVKHVPKDNGYGYFQHNGGEHVQRRSAIGLTDWLHPVVYSAIGSHASYPTTGSQDLDFGPVTYAHDFTGAGASWRTWADGALGLPNVTTTPWYGYAGAWGQATGNKDSTGPLGPSTYKSPL